MFRQSIVRQARLCRIVPSSRSILNQGFTSLRSEPACVDTSASRLATRSIPLLVARRGYSSSAAAQTNESHEGGVSTQDAPKYVTKFSELPSLGVHENLVNSLTRKFGYENMTEVQSMTINAALNGTDMVAQAKTGTGKTLAFLVPIVQRIIAQDTNLAFRGRHRARPDDIRAIILSPTRELAEQIGEEARRLCADTGVIVQTAVGGTQKASMLQQVRRQGCHLLVATPGRLFDILNDPNSGVDAPSLSTLVLDEADRMLDVGFERELEDIVRLLPDRRDSPRQTLLFSATIPSNVIRLARTYVDAQNFEFIQTIKADDVPTHESVPQFILPCRSYENVLPVLYELLDNVQKKSTEGGAPLKAMVFFQTNAMVQLATEMFRHLQRGNTWMPRVLTMNSKLTQAQRTRSSDHFRRAESAIMITSDVTARGMDFPNVSHVIQIGCPRDREQYIHRIGRTGRAGKSGEAWLLLAAHELDDARRALPGLPIKRAEAAEWASAAFDMGSHDPQPNAITVVSEAIRKAPEHLLTDAYWSMFSSVKSNMVSQTASTLGRWVRYGWGWDELPPIDRFTAQKRGLLGLKSINVVDQQPRRREYGRRDDRRPQFGRDSEDTFEEMRRSSYGTRRSPSYNRGDGRPPFERRGGRPHTSSF